MPLSSEVRSLLEFSIELLVIGGGLPTIFLQRPAWLREMRERYSFWKSKRGFKRYTPQNTTKIARLKILQNLLTFFLIPFLNIFGKLMWGAPVILGVLVLYHICLSYGNITFAKLLCNSRESFYFSLGFSILLVGLLWYQVYMTSFSQIARRIFWLAWCTFQREKGQEEANIPSFHKGWAYFVAQLQITLSPNWVYNLSQKNALQDLGRLGANTRTPQETLFILNALEHLADVIPLETSGHKPLVVQLCEATAHSLWPIESSSEEAFKKSLKIFQVVLERWLAERSKANNNNGTDASKGHYEEGSFLEYLLKVGQGILEYHPHLLRHEFLSLFTPYDDQRDNNSEARLLFLLGIQAHRQRKWESLLYIAEKLREYAFCTLEQQSSNSCKRETLEWIERCEPTIWYIGLLAFAVYQTPGAWPWVARYLDLDEDSALLQKELSCILENAQNFFTTFTLEPEVAQAISCLRQRLLPKEAEPPLGPCPVLERPTS